MSYVDEILAMKKPPKKKPAEVPKPNADVIPHPADTALARPSLRGTRASEIDRALAEEKRRNAERLDGPRPW